jgi:hypothetical protein
MSLHTVHTTTLLQLPTASLAALPTNALFPFQYGVVNFYVMAGQLLEEAQDK